MNTKIIVPFLALTTLLPCLHSSLAAQNEDPFGAPADARNTGDPFDQPAPFGDPFAPPKAAASQDKEKASSRRQEKIAQLEAAYKAFLQKVQESDVAYERLAPEQRTDWLRATLAQRTAKLAETYQELMETVSYLEDVELQQQSIQEDLHARYQKIAAELNSTREAEQRKLRESARLAEENERLYLTERFANELILKALKTKDNPLQVTVLEKLESEELGSSVGLRVGLELAKLAESNNPELSSRAARLLTTVSPDLAIQHGFQESHATWLPLEAMDHRFSPSARKQLVAEGGLFVAEYSLEETFEILGDDFDVNIVTAPDIEVDKILVDADIRSATLSGILTIVCGKHGLDFVIQDNAVKVYEIGHRDLSTTLTYEIRGLLTEAMDVEGIAQLLEALNEDQGNVEISVVGASRIMVQGRESDQRRISQTLAKLPRSF